MAYQTEIRELPFALACGDGVLQYPHPLSESDYRWMMEIFQKMKPRLTRQPKPPTVTTESSDA